MMTLRARMQIASIVSGVFFVASVVAVFVYPHLSQIFLVLGLLIGTKAVAWKRQLVPKASSKQTVYGPRSALYRFTMGIAWILLLLLTAALFWLGITRFVEWHTIKTQGIQVSGMVVDKEELPGSMTRMGTPSHHYYLTYEFQDQSAKDFRIRTSVDIRTWDFLAEGDPVPVKYLPQQPSNSRLAIDFEEQDEGASAFGVICLGVIFLGFGTWGFCDYCEKSKLRFPIKSES